MGKKNRPRQRCAATARDGQRCGRMCALGAVFCSAHDPNRKPTGVIAAQETNDLGELLRRLTKNADPAIRLRAIEAILKREEQLDCPVCKARQHADQKRTTFLHELTDEERERLAEILRELSAFKEEIYARDPSLRSDPELTSAGLTASKSALSKDTSPQVVDEPSAPLVKFSVTPTPETHSSAPEIADASPEMLLLPRARYSEVGLIVLASGAVTHALGDDHAQKILRGDISFADAKDMHDRAQRQSERLAVSLQENQHG